MKIGNYEVITLTKGEMDEIADAIKDRAFLAKNIIDIEKFLKSHCAAVRKLLDICEDPVTSDKEKDYALWAIRHLIDELDNKTGEV